MGAITGWSASGIPGWQPLNVKVIDGMQNVSLFVVAVVVVVILAVTWRLRRSNR